MDINWVIAGPLITLALAVVTGVLRIGSFSNTFGNMEESINNIEDAVTSVDFQVMERKLIALAASGGSNNSVRKTLEESGVEATISLIGKDEGSRIEVSFDDDIKTRTMTELLGKDKELTKREKELFGSEPQCRNISPRRIHCEIPSNDFNKVAKWIKPLLEKLDQFCVEMRQAEELFDEKVEKSLNMSDRSNTSEE